MVLVPKVVLFEVYVHRGSDVKENLRTVSTSTSTVCQPKSGGFTAKC